jgi:hypothetical protein
MSLFHHISFPKIDPLGDGLREEIIAEQDESQAITLDDIDEGTLSSYWKNVEQDIEQDPSWFRFDNEE